VVVTRGQQGHALAFRGWRDPPLHAERLGDVSREVAFELRLAGLKSLEHELHAREEPATFTLCRVLVGGQDVRVVGRQEA